MTDKQLFEGVTPRSRVDIAKRVAQDVAAGWCVNLGIGIPTMIADYVPASHEVIFHSENGILGMGTAPREQDQDPWLINAGKQYASLVTGAAIIHHADSFAIARGGHLDLCVLGAYQVSENGDLANWAIEGGAAAPAVGGAMDLAVGAKRVWLLMTHLSKTGVAKLTKNCTYPLTAAGCVKRIYTDYAVIDVTENGFEAIELVDGLTIEQLQQIVDAPIKLAKQFDA